MAKQQGYLLVDHQASPGLPEDIARAAGYDPKLVGEGKRLETTTFTCAHCKVAVVPNPFRVREREHCFKCNHYICDICAFKASMSDYDHMPFDKKVDLTLGGMVLGSPQKLLTS